MYNNMVEETEVKLVTELKYNLLEAMLKFSLRVRPFSLAKDLNYKQKLKLITKGARHSENKLKSHLKMNKNLLTNS